uniref:uncharacterized protein NKAPD1 isoform X2 n=1 Tax=Euleptes europaea TaxID=460621 RepID=UPI0025412676|nr:uncharacterized protein NKAPD1 isoform X2 [Euleptes europaea]
MSRVPLGKVLLRNVIRHTDAHNKIQEESEMWKIREMEKQTEEVHQGKQKSLLSNSSSRMRSDGFDEGSQHNDWKVRNFAPVSVTTEDDLRHARYWNKKLYECEASMPDRWGHSGYKELYPEEFDTDSDQQERDKQNSLNGKRKSQPGRRSSLELHKKKKAKKSHKKKRKKKSHKKRKKKKREQLSVTSDSSQESECSEASASGTGKQRQQRHKKAKKTPTKRPASSSGQDSGSSGSEDSEPRGKLEKQPKKKRRKHCSSTSERCSEGVQEKRSKRKNWKVAADEKSEDSSDED